MKTGEGALQVNLAEPASDQNVEDLLQGHRLCSVQTAEL